MLRLFRYSIFVLLAALPLAAEGAVVFSEVMYDVPGADQGREWVEIQNIGAEPVDLTGWKLLENGAHHKVAALGATILAPGVRAVVADSAETYLSEHPGYSGLLFDSSFSLKNTGETLILENASGTNMASITYVPKPKPPPTPKAKEPAPQKTRNPEPTPAVTEEPATTPASVAAAAEPVIDTTKAQTSFSILPWIAGLIAVTGLGIVALFMGKPKNKSGYTIIEDKT